MKESLNLLNLPDGVTLTGQDSSMPSLEVATAVASATILIQGAQLLSWAPTGTDAVIWTSPDAVYQPGKSVRGGIPICWPWFGAAATEGLPAHGYARTRVWQLSAVTRTPDDTVVVQFDLPVEPNLGLPGEGLLAASFELHIGERLSVRLTTHNTSDDAFEITSALHTYFNVSDVRNISIAGLEGDRFIDTLRGDREDEEAQAITVSEEIDRIYYTDGGAITLRDPDLGREIVIRSQGSASSIVWNPWVDKCARLGDMGDAGYLQMMCIETANAREDSVTLATGEKHVLVADYAIQNIKPQT